MPSASVLSVVLLLAPWAGAQEPKKERARLDTKSLGEMLADMGLEAKLVDERFQKIRWTVKDWTSPVWLSVADDKRTVWLYTEFALRPDFGRLADLPAVLGVG